MKPKKIKHTVAISLTEGESKDFVDRVQSLPRPWTKSSYVAKAVVEKVEREKQ